MQLIPIRGKGQGSRKSTKGYFLSPLGRGSKVRGGSRKLKIKKAKCKITV